MVGFEKVEKRRMSLYGSTMQIYKTYNTTLLKVLPASGKLGFILIRCSRSSILVGFRHEIRQITPEMLQNVRDACYYRFAICQERNGAHFEHLLH
jgi:hypothetical protein